MVKQPKEVYVFVGKPAYIYREDKGENRGMMFETHLTTRFVANSYGEALKDAVAHTRERYEAYFKDTYKECSIGSIKVYVEVIGRIDSDGKANGGIAGFGAFFEWKCDYPADLDTYVEEFLSKPESKLHIE